MFYSIVSHGDGPTVLTIVTGDGTAAVTSTSPNFDAACSAAIAGDWDEAFELAQPITSIARKYQEFTDRLKVADGKVYFDSSVVDDDLAAIILKDDFSPSDDTLMFIERCLANPSASSRAQLYRWAETNKVELSPDGYMLLWKGVLRTQGGQHEYSSINHGDETVYVDGEAQTGSNLFSSGSEVWMDRSLVDDDPDSLCSAGLHVSTEEYARWFVGAREDGCLVKVFVDPADIVSVPRDYNDQKIRTCRYLVA